jgi:peptide chain release factor 2
MIPSSDLRVESVLPESLGGQHVGYTGSTVRVTHVPTGTVSQVTSRSQHRARGVAIRMIEAALTDPEFR